MSDKTIVYAATGLAVTTIPPLCGGVSLVVGAAANGFGASLDLFSVAAGGFFVGAAWILVSLPKIRQGVRDQLKMRNSRDAILAGLDELEKKWLGS